MASRGRPQYAHEVERLTNPVDTAWVRGFPEAFPLFHDAPDWYLEDRVSEAVR